MSRIQLIKNSVRKHPVFLVLSLAILSGLFITSLDNFLLFHTTVEVFSILIAFGIYMFAWNSRFYFENNLFLIIGIAYLFVGSLDFLHVLSYKGMNIFDNIDANIPTQLWISARYIESISIAVGIIYAGRKISEHAMIFIYAMVTLFIVLAIFEFRVFPDCFVADTGLTPFKIISEYIISGILLVSILLLKRKKTEFATKVYYLMNLSILLTIAAELFFTFYINVYGLSNILGHFCKLVSFYLIYKVVISIGIIEPFEILFRNLKQSEKTLIEANAAKDKFFSIISHDLRSPFQAILWFSDTLKKHFSELSQEKRIKYVDSIFQASNKTYILLENLLQWAQVQTNQIKCRPDKVDLLSLIDDCITLSQIAASKKKIQIHKDYSENTTIYVDADMIKTVLRNLVSNAIKFTPVEGSITIKTQINLDVVQISVSDTGIGIDEQEKTELFQVGHNKIRSGTNNEQGTGLGLLLCKEFVEKNGGKIWVESQQTIGSTFAFHIPLVC